MLGVGDRGLSTFLPGLFDGPQFPGLGQHARGLSGRENALQRQVPVPLQLFFFRLVEDIVAHPQFTQGPAKFHH